MTPDDQIPYQYRKTAYDARRRRFPMFPIIAAAMIIFAIVALLCRHG